MHPPPPPPPLKEEDDGGEGLGVEAPRRQSPPFSSLRRSISRSSIKTAWINTCSLAVSPLLTPPLMRCSPIVRRGMCLDSEFPQDLDFSLTFTDSFLGRCRRLALDATGNPLPPPEQRAQIRMPLDILKAVEWFFPARRRLTGGKRHREDSVAPLGHMLVQFSPCVPLRVMFGFVATSCRRLVTAPAGIHVNSRSIWRWSEWIFERVTRGRVRRVQVRGYPPAARLLSRAGFLSRIAANAG